MTAVTLVSTRTSDGVLLQGALAGPDGAGAGVIAVHGAWGNFYASPSAALLDVAPARGAAALSLNLRSHDLATLGDGEPCIGFARHRMEDSALDLDAALRLLLDAGVERVAVAAHSYGSHMAAHWLKLRRPPEVMALSLSSPAPPLQWAERWFVEGALDHHLALAARAVAENEPNRLVVISSSAPVPMVAEAATVLDVWGKDTQALSQLHVGEIGVPLLVTSGQREPSVYRRYAELVAGAAQDVELVLVDDDHYYALDRRGFAGLLLDWFEQRGLAG